MTRVTCGRCKKSLPAEQFSKSSHRSTGYNYACRPCARDHMRQYRIDNPEYNINNQLQSRYGITLNKKREILGAQNNQCAICFRLLYSINDAHIDHCHKTGAIRGILCFNCNGLLGQAKDDVHTLRNAITYLGVD